MGLVLYFIGFVMLYTGMFLIRKSEEEQNAAVFIVVTAVLFMMVQTFEAGIIDRIPGIRISAASFGCLHVVEGSVLLYASLSRKNRQKYFAGRADAGVLILLAVFVMIVSVRQFGAALDDFNFTSDCDAARHYIFARNVADGGSLIGLFFSSLNSGLIMNALQGLVDAFSFYRVFILFEMGVLFLNGAMFWVLIRRYLKDKRTLAAGAVITIAYMLGYPWNSMVFGTSYLSTGILCVATILFLLDMYFHHVYDSDRRMIFLLFLSCYGLLHSYSLFVPPVLGGIFLLAAFRYAGSAPANAQKVRRTGSILFVICLLAGIAFLYLWLGKGLLSKELYALSWWGNIYGALYADFVFAAPFCVDWFVKSVKSKTVNVECVALSVFLSYIFVLFLGNHFGKISAYYYYKSYSILWIAAFMMMAKSIVTPKRARTLMYGYILTWAALFLVYISSAEEKLPQEYHLNLTVPSGGRTAADYFGLYHFNIVHGPEDVILKETKELYMEAAGLSAQTGEFIPYIGEYLYHEWTYFALAGTEHKNVTEGKNYAAAVEELQKHPYILSVECEDAAMDMDKFLKTLPILYENESGKIYKVEGGQTAAEDGNGHMDVDIISRYGFPRLERMVQTEQDAQVNCLQVIQKMENLGLDKDAFLYPELSTGAVENAVSALDDECADSRETIVFDGTTSEELQQMIDDYPNAVIDIRTKTVEMNDTIVLRNYTSINGNGAKFAGYGLECAFAGDGKSDICLNNICIEGKINYGIYLTDCRNFRISDCTIDGLLQKPVCIVGTASGFNISNNKMCGNRAGGLCLAGDVSDGCIESNDITDNGGTGMLFTCMEPEDETRRSLPGESLQARTKCPHEIIVRNNNVSNNQASGIYSDGAYQCYLIQNTVYQNSEEGISLNCGTIGFYLEGNLLERNGQNTNQSDGLLLPGISMDNAAYNILRNNILLNNYGCGIKMASACVRNLIMENIVEGAADNAAGHLYGIMIGAQAAGDERGYADAAPGFENIVCRNSVTGGFDSGVFIGEACDINDVFDNVIMETRMFAVESASTKFNSIMNNVSSAGIRNAYEADTE